MKVVFDDKKTRAGRIQFTSSEVTVTNHALDRFIERGSALYVNRERALQAFARAFVKARVVKTIVHGSKVPRDTEVHESEDWRFLVDRLRKRVTTCYLLEE